MPIDASIYNQLGQGVPQIDVAGSMGKGMQLRQLVQQKQDDQKMRELAPQAGNDLGKLADLYQQQGLYKQSMEVRAKHLAQQKEIATIQETLGKVDKQRRDAIDAGNADVAKMALWADTPEKWQQGMTVILNQHPVIAGGLQPFAEYTPDNRKAVITRAQQVQAAIDGLKPKVEERSGAQVPVVTDVLGQQTVGAPVGVKAQTVPGQAAQDATNGVILPTVAAELTKKAITHAPGVTVNTGEKLPPGWRQDPDKPGSWKPIPGGPHDNTSKDKPLTQDQGNALGFGIRAREADVILNEIEASGANISGGAQKVISSVPGVGNYATPPALQKYDQAKRNFVSAVLRKESGAAISASEFTNEEKKYFPQPGDSMAVIQQKADARKTAIGVLQIQSGRDLPEVVKPVAAEKPKAKAPLQSGKVWTVKTDADYTSLPVGARYKGPDDVERTK